MLNKAEVGNIIQLRRAASRYTHSIIINQISGGDIYYCSHTNDVRTGSLRTRVLENPSYYRLRLVHITY